MEIWTGIITTKIEASRDFYKKLLDAQVLFESDWFILLDCKGRHLAFMLPGLENQAELFKQPLQTAGMWIGVNTQDVDADYERIKAQGFDIAVEIRDEPWGDRHFTVKDPNGIGVDFVKHQAQ